MGHVNGYHLNGHVLRVQTRPTRAYDSRHVPRTHRWLGANHHVCRCWCGGAKQLSRGGANQRGRASARISSPTATRTSTASRHAYANPGAAASSSATAIRTADSTVFATGATICTSTCAARNVLVRRGAPQSGRQYISAQSGAYGRNLPSKYIPRLRARLPATTGSDGASRTREYGEVRVAHHVGPG